MSNTSYPSGAASSPDYAEQPNPYATNPYAAGPQQYPSASGKSFLVTWLLSLLIGYFGADRFYLGKIGTGVLKLVTLGGLGIWYLVDLIMTLAGATRDKAGRRLEGYEKQKKVAWIVSAIVVVFGMITGQQNFDGGTSSSFSSSASDSSTTTPAAAASSAPADAASASAETAVETTVTETPAAEETAAEETVAEEAVAEETLAEEPEGSGAAAWAAGKFGEFATITKKGTGDTVIKLPAGVTTAMVTATYNGEGNFAVIGLDEANDSTDLLVNTIGSYKGTTALGVNAFQEVKSLQVQASGPWTLSIETLGNAKAFASKGSGDAVMLYEGSSATLTATHRGEGNFAVFEENDELFNMGLLVNEIGNYSGTVPLSSGPSLIIVQADGSWTLATE
ncbi:TM2 domain-containing membrane protein YozV [Neomicrococcus aestuarii]|uniref:TM2 domain-containing membrane protein YozV n=1 Tax=Neomicrococcus aestuarii TaxID=556325 RepID=A0A7W8WXR1_9MICC|nr:TM2 domain-containing protein [Neomicrococcus aestuarii]MBB5511521.1 TM2 domain-containing membrane protein YozV [Neomicrococcus aestuarii]